MKDEVTKDQSAGKLHQIKEHQIYTELYVL